MTVSEDSAYPSTSSDDSSGLTKREYFAAMALQGILTNAEFLIRSRDTPIEQKAVNFADKLIAELSKDNDTTPKLERFP